MITEDAKGKVISMWLVQDVMSQLARIPAVVASVHAGSAQAQSWDSCQVSIFPPPPAGTPALSVIAAPMVVDAAVPDGVIRFLDSQNTVVAEITNLGIA